MAMSGLNIIGAGKVGRVLGRQFFRSAAFRIEQVVNRSLPVASASVAFIGGGHALAGLAHVQAADVTMLSVADDQIEATCDAMAARGLFQPGSVVFHCSGAKASNLLASASAAGASVASLHPVASFADQARLADHFAGTICSLEGDEAALQLLIPALQAVQARVVQISAANKLLYHAGSVFASNYLVTWMETALQAYQAAGIPSDIAKAMAEPLARQSLENVFQMGTAAALTGPIARGDMATVALQQQVVSAWDANAGNLYQAFTPPSVVLAARKSK
jgi:predicted short-subunit dehydrogenase-like oxidoreductase (DUF2520 family)